MKFSSFLAQLLVNLVTVKMSLIGGAKTFTVTFTVRAIRLARIDGDR